MQVEGQLLAPLWPLNVTMGIFTKVTEGCTPGREGGRERGREGGWEGGREQWTGGMVYRSSCCSSDKHLSSPEMGWCYVQGMKTANTPCAVLGKHFQF